MSLFSKGAYSNGHDLMVISTSIPELDAIPNVENVNDPGSCSIECGHGREWNKMPRLDIGDRVEIVGEVADQFPSSIGIITATEGTVSLPKFRVRLADGTESVFWDSQLQVPPVMFADMIYDTHVSPVPTGLRGSISEHHMRFISREFDIHVKLSKSEERAILHGQLSANGVAPKSSLVTLLFNHSPLATTVADSCGEFRLEQIPSGDAMLEIFVPSRRIVAAFDVSPG